MSAYQWPDGSLEVSAKVDVPAPIAAAGRAAVLAHVAKALFDAADKALDQIEKANWPTCYICGRLCTPGSNHEFCERRCRSLQSR
jgi:hypothetical protein